MVARCIAIALAIHRLRSASAADCRAADWVEVRIRRALRRHLAATESVGFALDDAALCRSNERDNLGLQPRWNAELGHRGAQKVDRTIPILGGQAHAAMRIRHRTADIKPATACGTLHKVDNELLFACHAVGAAMQPKSTELVRVILSHLH